MALTTIDTVTNYPNIVRLSNKTSQHVAQQLENSWLHDVIAQCDASTV